MIKQKLSLSCFFSLKYNGKKLRNKEAFTLVELIVVITILAILGTIAFISLEGYSRDARDSVRISDMSKIKTSLELFQLDAGKYPETTDYFTITYSGALARTQGYFGGSTFFNVEKLDKIPKDPLTEKKYIYSTTNTRQEFEIAGIIEGDFFTYLSNQVNAGDKEARLKITGTYNGKILKVSTGGLDYVLAVPSIINGRGFTLDEIIQNKYVAYNGYKNLPAQYDGTKYNVLGDPDITLVNYSDYEIFSGNLGDLSDSTQTGTTARADFITNLQSAYTGTVLSSIGEIEEILNISGDDAIESLASTIVNNDLGGSFIANTNNNVSGGVVPVNSAGGIIFTDTDTSSGLVGGNVTITPASDESDVTHYVLYWADNSNVKVGSAIATVAKGVILYTLSSGTSIPSGATKLLVITKNSYGEMVTGVLTSFTDDISGDTPILEPVTYLTYSYPIALMADGKYWTQNTLKHKPINGMRRCYNNSSSCTYRMYDMPGAVNACTLLGDGWRLPTNIDWQGIIANGATGWTGNKMFGIVDFLGGIGADSLTTYSNAGSSVYYWSSNYSMPSRPQIYRFEVDSSEIIYSSPVTDDWFMYALCVKD